MLEATFTKAKYTGFLCLQYCVHVLFEKIQTFIVHDFEDQSSRKKGKNWQNFVRKKEKKRKKKGCVNKIVSEV